MPCIFSKYHEVKLIPTNQHTPKDKQMLGIRLSNENHVTEEVKEEIRTGIRVRIWIQIWIRIGIKIRIAAWKIS